jgi:heme exporter protein B
MVRKILQRGWLIGWRGLGQCMPQLVFASLVVSLFPLALSPAPETLRSFAPALVIIAVLFASFLTMHTLFEEDVRSGVLDDYICQGGSLGTYATIKTAMLIIFHGVPLLLTCPLYLLLLQGDVAGLGQTLLAVFFTLTATALLGAAMAALALGSARSTLLLPLLLLPLLIPVLIFATALASHAMNDPIAMQALAFLAALVMFYGLITPFLNAAALRSAVEAA